MVVEGVNPHVLVDEAGEEVDGVARGLVHDVDVAGYGGPLAGHQIAVFPASDDPDLQGVVVSDGEAIGVGAAAGVGLEVNAQAPGSRLLVHQQANPLLQWKADAATTHKADDGACAHVDAPKMAR